MPEDLDTDIQRYVHTKTYLHTLIFMCTLTNMYGDMYIERPTIHKHVQTCTHTDLLTGRYRSGYTEIFTYNDMYRDSCSETCTQSNMPTTGTAAQKCP